MKTTIFAILLLAGAFGTAGAQPVTSSEAGAIASTLMGAVNQVMEDVKNVIASAKAQARVKETFARQRVAGKPPRADKEALEAALRLALRANSGRLGSGRMWRAYPGDEAYAARAAVVAKAFEEHVATLGPIRSWGCSYDHEADLIMNGSIGPLALAGKRGLTAQPAPPPFTAAETAYRFGPMPEALEPLPVADRKSAAWLDWAAANSAETVVQKMREQASRQEGKGPKKPLKPDPEKVKETVWMWTLAAAAENGAPEPPMQAERLAAEAAAVTRAVSRTYGLAASKSLLRCEFYDFFADRTGRAAKRLLAQPAK